MSENEVTQSSSDQFLRLLKSSVVFPSDFPQSENVRDQLIELVAYGQADQAATLVTTESNLTPAQAHEFVHEIESAADRVNYATGLRP